MICGYCMCLCDPVEIDHSFDHAFGTEIHYEIVSECCGETIFWDDGLTQVVTWDELASAAIANAMDSYND